MKNGSVTTDAVAPVVKAAAKPVSSSVNADTLLDPRFTTYRYFPLGWTSAATGVVPTATGKPGMIDSEPVEGLMLRPVTVFSVKFVALIILSLGSTARPIGLPLDG